MARVDRTLGPRKRLAELEQSEAPDVGRDVWVDPGPGVTGEEIEEQIRRARKIASPNGRVLVVVPVEHQVRYG